MDEVFTRRTNGGETEVIAEAFLQSCFRGGDFLSPQPRCWLQSYFTVIDQQYGRLCGRARYTKCVAASSFTRDSEAATRQRVIDTFREGTLADNCELGRCCQWTSNQWTEGEDDGSFRLQRLNLRGTFVQEKIRKCTDSMPRFVQ